MLIRVKQSIKKEHSIAQDIDDTRDIIYEVADDFSPSVSYVEVGDIPIGFMQLVQEGKFGRYMDIATIDEVTELKDGLEKEEIDDLNTLNELRLYKITVEQEEDIDFLALEVLELKGV